MLGENAPPSREAARGPPLSRLFSRAACASTFLDIAQMESLLGGQGKKGSASREWSLSSSSKQEARRWVSGFFYLSMRSQPIFKMADSDEDTFASFGTPLEILEEDVPRKKAVPIHEQIVTDTEGRRRFHGAFTGGFSAGYFNSVGTKEGWQPSTFVSSRSKKMEQRAQRPEDFMDEEDIGEFGIAPKRITTKEKFSVLDREPQSRKRVVEADDALRVIPGEPVLQDLVLPVKMSVGVELLKKMGWKEGQGIGPRERRSKKKVIIMLSLCFSLFALRVQFLHL